MLALDDGEPSEALLGQSGFYVRPSKRFNPRWYCASYVSYVLNAVLLVCLVVFAGTQSSLFSSCDCLRPFEDIYDDADSLFGQLSSVHFDTDSVSASPDFKTFWGRHWFENSPEAIDKLWHDLSSVQLLSITADEAARLPFPTARNPDTPGTFAIMPQVFHDVHCLRYIRNHAMGRPSMHNETARERLTHVEHCLGIIRQSILCEGNLQPVVFTSVNGMPFANPGAVARTCRDWGALWEWGRERNISSGTVERTS